MNGARTTFLRRGYLLTALAAARAARGVPRDGGGAEYDGHHHHGAGPEHGIHEGGTATYTVAVRGYIPVADICHDPQQCLGGVYERDIGPRPVSDNDPTATQGEEPLTLNTNGA